MDGQHDNALHPFDEIWFDVADQCGREFQIPNLCSPINPRWSDNSNNLVFLPDQQPHTPDLLDNSHELDMISTSCAANQVDSFLVMEMVPSITNCVPTADQEEGTSTANHKVQFPRSNGLPKSDSYSWKSVDINFSLRNQDFLVVNAAKSPSMISLDSLFFKNKRFRTSPNACQLDSDDRVINNHVCFSSSGCPPSFGSGGSLPLRNQEIRSFNFTDSPSFFQNGSCVRWNQIAHVPVMTNTSGTGADGNINYGPNPLQNVSHCTEIRSSVSMPVENHVGSSIHAPLSNCERSKKNKDVGPSSLKNGRRTGKYTCKVCNREFPDYNSYGGHMSFHAKAERVGRNLASQKDASMHQGPRRR